MNKQNTIETLFSYPPFELDYDKKSNVFFPAMKEAFDHHIDNNELFRNFCHNQGFEINNEVHSLADYPYLPVNIFKQINLSSVADESLIARLSSSATSGVPSTVAIDALTSKRQMMASAKVMADYLGGKRRPFLVLDVDPLASASSEISARSAATRGFLILSSQSEYFLNEENGSLCVDFDKFDASLKTAEDAGQEICIFGFTYVLYHYIVKMMKNKGIKYNLPANAKILHIGGWKKLESEKVSKEKFLNDVSDVFGVDHKNIFDFYGFTEQMGLIYASEGASPKVCPIYSDIIIRDFQTLQPVEDGKSGLIQILTPLPYSYPGISVLTEDVGRIISREEVSGGRMGVQFEIVGRATKAEARGCGDIMSEIIL